MLLLLAHRSAPSFSHSTSPPFSPSPPLPLSLSPSLLFLSPWLLPLLLPFLHPLLFLSLLSSTTLLSTVISLKFALLKQPSTFLSPLVTSILGGWSSLLSCLKQTSKSHGERQGSFFLLRYSTSEKSGCLLPSFKIYANIHVELSNIRTTTWKPYHVFFISTSMAVDVLLADHKTFFLRPFIFLSVYLFHVFLFYIFYYSLFMHNLLISLIHHSLFHVFIIHCFPILYCFHLFPSSLIYLSFMRRE